MKMQLAQAGTTHGSNSMSGLTLHAKFGFGDQFYEVLVKKVNVRVVCDFCGGVGRIPALNDKSVYCAECCGKGYDFGKEIVECAEINGPLTVGEVRVCETRSPGIEQSGIEFDNYKPQVDREESYMAVETGIGSGRVYKVENMYATHSEATDAADAINTQAAKAVTA